MASNPVIPADKAVDPTLFAVNWDVTFEVLVMIIVLAFIFERALAVLFESDAFIRFEKSRDAAGKGSFKSFIAFGVAAIGCYFWDFDALSILMQREHVTTLGAVVTGAVVAGGSKAAIKLFHDVFDAKSSAFRRFEDGKEAASTPPPAPAVAAAAPQAPPQPRGQAVPVEP